MSAARRMLSVAAMVLAATAVSATVASAAEDAAAEVSANEDPALGLEPAALFKAGVDALAADRPAAAIANLEALGDRGVVDPVVSYDRGLAYAARVRAGAAAELPGDLGRAAHGFEEARQLSHDAMLVADATAALAAVRAEVARRRSHAGDPIELDSGESLGRSIVKLLPENVWAVLGAICSAALAVGIVLRARAKLRRLKVAGTTTIFVAGSLLVLVTYVLSSARDMREHMREAVIIAPEARLLDDKHVALLSVAALPEGARLQLLGEGAGFAHVVIGRAVGWLPSGALLPIAK